MASSARRLEKMEVQLERWSARIDRVAAKTEGAGAWVTIGEHHRIDELRVWRAIAQARFDAYRTAEPPERQGLRGGGRGRLRCGGGQVASGGRAGITGRQEYLQAWPDHVTDGGEQHGVGRDARDVQERAGRG